MKGPGRTLADFEPLSKAERKLRDEVGTGQDVVISGGVPEAESDAVRIRAGLIRYLILGGCPACRLHEKGVRVRGAFIDGDGPAGAETRGLDLEGCTVAVDLVLFACHIPDAVLLRSAQVRNVYLNDSRLENGLSSDRLAAKGDVVLRGATVTGEVRLPGATLGGNLGCDGAALTAGKSGNALNADRLDAKGGVFLRGATVTGEVRLLGATLGGDLDCNGATLAARESGDALSADGLDAKGGVFLSKATVTGEVRLLGATLGGELACVGATLTARESGKALNSDGLDAKGGVFLSKATVTGEVRLLGATLGGDLTCDGATLTAGESGNALSADGLDAKGGVFLPRATVTGAVRLPGATLGGDLTCDGATLTAGESGDAMTMSNARIGGAWFWRDGAIAKGWLDFRAATIGTLADDPACWPWPGEGGFVLDRCQYGAFLGGGISGDERKAWLLRQPKAMIEGPDFCPQPWEQCARVLREMGHAEDARQILIEKERRQRAAKRQRLRDEHLYEDADLRAIADSVLGATVRYGRQPLLAFVWLFGFWLLGVWTFATAAADNAIKPNNAVILRSPEWFACQPDYRPPVDVGEDQQTDTSHRNEGTSQLGCFLSQDEAASYPRFNAALYSLDTLLPIVSMEMQGFWIPDETKAPVGTLARWYLWLHIAAGWALSLLAVAGFSGLVKSD